MPGNGKSIGLTSELQATTVMLNTTNSVQVADIWTSSGDLRFLAVGIAFLVIILGTAGNGLTVWAYKSNRNLQTSFNVLIANLCCVELLFSLVVIPLQLPGMITGSMIQLYPDAFCTISGYLYYCSFTASLHNLVAIAINRYIGIVNTKKYQGLFTGNRLRLWVASIWITSPLLYIPLAVGGNIQWSNTSLRCSITSDTNAVGIYNMILNIIYQAGGLITLISLYSAIIEKVKQVKKKIKIHKKASFRSSATSHRRSGTLSKDPKVDIHTPGTTSGEEGIEDYRPDSIISGGFNFRPAKDGSMQGYQSDSGPSDREMVTAKQRNVMSDNHSHASVMTPLRTPSPNPKSTKAKRRGSLWQMIFRKKSKDKTPKDQVEDQRSHTIDITTDDEKITKDSEHKTPVVMRNMDEITKKLRRKKSLSAPTMPTPEELMQISRKNSSIVKENIPDKLEEANESISTESSPSMHRAFTVGAKYKKRVTRRENGGSFRVTAESTKFLHPNCVVSRFTAADKALCTSLPTLQQNEILSSENHAKSGTIAKRIRDQKSRKGKTTKRRERLKAMKRRHARERQLVYSSLWICIAYAVLILPTSILFMAQSLFKFKTPAAVILTINAISWLHAVVNPFIYGYMNHLYRKEYAKIAKAVERSVTSCVK